MQRPPELARLGMHSFVFAPCIALSLFFLAGCDDLPAPSASRAPVSASHASGRFGQRMLPGTKAPDFNLPSVRDPGQVHLKELCEDQPVVLILGSFGCDYFCLCLDDLKQLHDRFEDRAEFLFVYVDNNHPEPRFTPAAQESSNPLLQDRVAKIREGLEHYQIPFPCVLDSADKQTLQEYQAFPARLFIIDQKGEIALDSGSVTRTGLNLAEVETWLENHPAQGE